MASNRPKIDESKYHFEISHEKYSKPTSVEMSGWTIKELKQMFPDKVPVSITKVLPLGRKTTCEIFDAKRFNAWIERIRATDKTDKIALQEVRESRPTPIATGEAVCSLFDNFSKETGAIKAKGRAKKALWHWLYGDKPVVAA